MRNVSGEGVGRAGKTLYSGENIYKVNFLKHTCHSFVPHESLSIEPVPKEQMSPHWMAAMPASSCAWLSYQAPSGRDRLGLELCRESSTCCSEAQGIPILHWTLHIVFLGFKLCWHSGSSSCQS